MPNPEQYPGYGVEELDRELERTMSWLSRNVTTPSGNPIAYVKPGHEPSIFRPRTVVSGEGNSMALSIKMEKVLGGLQKLFHGNRKRFLSSGKELAKGHRGYFMSEHKTIADSFGSRQGGQTYAVRLKNITEKDIFDPSKDKAVEKLLDQLSKYRNLKPGSFKRASVEQGLRTGRYSTYEDPLTTMALQDLGYKGNIQTEASSAPLDTLRLFSRENIKSLE